MATKQVLFYSLRKRYSDNWDVIAVTTLKPKRYHGSVEPYHETTHGLLKDLTGKFGTEAEARAVIDKVAVVHKAYEPALRSLEKQLQDCRHLQAAAVQEVLDKAGAGKVSG